MGERLRIVDCGLRIVMVGFVAHELALTIRNPQSEIRNWQVRNPQSAIRNPVGGTAP